MRALRSAAASFFLFFAVGLALSWPALRWPMVYDDLHLLRPFTPQERAQAWRGSWDPDGIEHAGLRPLTLAFNDVRYRLFGEDVAAHRVFLVSLFALYVTVLVRVASALGVPAPAAIGSGLLLLCSRYSVYHYVWLTDGVYLLQGLLVGIAALALVAGVRGRSGTRLAAALAAFAAAVLVREDTLALVPVLLLLGLVAAPRERRVLALFAAALLATSAALFFYRLRAVPEAASPGLDAGGLAVAVARALNLVGPESFDRASRILAWTWTGASVLVAVGLIAKRHAVDVRPPFVFLAAAVLACTPALTFRRDNLLFLPVSFAAFYYGSGLWALARGRPPLRVAAALLFASGVLGGAYVSRVFALNFHADSARAVRWNAQMLHGPNAARATIPPDRRDAVARQLAAQGVTSAADLRPLGARIGRARAEGPFRPGAPGTLFFPPLPEGDF
jgi:hypothetical protein